MYDARYLVMIGKLYLRHRLSDLVLIDLTSEALLVEDHLEEATAG
jgi:hypothetical protein